MPALTATATREVVRGSGTVEVVEVVDDAMTGDVGGAATIVGAAAGAAPDSTRTVETVAAALATGRLAAAAFTVARTGLRAASARGDDHPTDAIEAPHSAPKTATRTTPLTRISQATMSTGTPRGSISFSFVIPLLLSRMHPLVTACPSALGTLVPWMPMRPSPAPKVW